MAQLELTPSNFIGWERIVANDFKSEVLQSYIDTFYKKYLREIIGDEAYIAISSEDVQKWTDLLEGVNYVDVNGKKRIYDGLKTSLVRFIYFEFVRDNFTSTQVGKVSQANENSTSKEASEVVEVARSRYNEAVFCVQGLPDFLEANEEISQEITGFVDNGGGDYTLNISSTKYLSDGNSITFEGSDYVVSNLVEDTSIDVNLGSAGLTPSGSVSWKPYEEVSFCEIEVCGI